ncbi:MAG: hypothetical protein LC667_20655, partial [Thioalkalivibrio sp.]|nr:hypothetical protein [Thioalkalivibrio sp.]
GVAPEDGHKPSAAVALGLEPGDITFQCFLPQEFANAPLLAKPEDLDREGAAWLSLDPSDISRPPCSMVVCRTLQPACRGRRGTHFCSAPRLSRSRGGCGSGGGLDQDGFSLPRNAFRSTDRCCNDGDRGRIIDPCERLHLECHCIRRAFCVLEMVTHVRRTRCRLRIFADLEEVAGNLKTLAVLTRSWSGAEIEQGIKSAAVHAWEEGRELNERDVFWSTARIVPLSKTMSEQIKALRTWSQDRATPASHKGLP